MNERKLKVGIIGVGFFGQHAHIVNYIENSNCEVIALAEYRPILRRLVATRYNVPRTYSSHKQLLSDKDIEAVVVVTPRQYTAPTVLDCLKAGKHVMSEKPMAGTVEHGEMLVKAAEMNGVKYVVGYMKRYDEGVQTAKNVLKQVIDSKELGPIIYTRTHCFAGDSYCNPWGHINTDEIVNYPDEGWDIAPEWLPDEWRKMYEAYLNTYSHNTNLMRYLLEMSPEVVSANVKRNNGQVVVLDYGDFLSTIETGVSSNRGWDEVTEIYFNDGRITIKTPPALLRNTPAIIEIYRAGKVQEINLPQVYWSWSFRRQAEAFVSDILNNKESLNPGHDALEDLRLIEEIWRKDQSLT